MKSSPTLLFILFLCTVCFSLEGKPNKVTLQKGEDGISWQMFVDDEPFYAKGAAATMFHEEAKEFGANSVRFYFLKPESEEFLDRMAAAGLMVHAGVNFHQVRGTYYKNVPNAIEVQEERILDIVRRFKDHPAILCWSLGNEMEIKHGGEPLTEQWESIQRIAKAIHEIDPNHPVTMTIMESCEPAKIHGLNDICKDLDFLSVNCYPNLENGKQELPQIITKLGWTKPYMLTEYGPVGTWHHEQLGRRWTPWGALVELTSTQKEEFYLEGTQTVLNDSRCIGYFCFLWGYQKFGEVLGWYSLFNKEKYSFGAVDVMQYFWNGEYPAKRAPRIEDLSCMTINGQTAMDWVVLAPSSDNRAAVKATNPAGGRLLYHWFIFKEKEHCEDGSMNEDGIPGLIIEDRGKKVKFKAPSEKGGYRLYVHVSDERTKKVAAACIPFKVE